MKKVAYQVKEAFSFSDATLAEFKDNIGPLYVKLRDSKYIDLSFKDSDVQSRLNIDMPHRPHLKYIQSMLVAPILLPDFETTLILGFGGGSLAKYYTEFYKNTTKVIVDLRPKLFDIAQEFFQYSPDYNTTLVPGDASVFLNRARSRGDKYDIVNTDIFIEGPVDLQLHRYFWEDINSVMSSRSVCVTNVWRGDYVDKYEKIVRHHKDIFPTVFQISNSETDQVALFGSHLPLEMLLHRDVEIKAIEMSGLTAVNFRTHLRNLRSL
tara:strand:- start:17228 stop:18025 length:798 start_codon:yes stop_codon:yes gene_type:complete